MFLLFFLFFVPIFISGQDHTTTQAPRELDPKCLPDFQRFKDCIKNPAYLSRIDDIPSSNNSTNFNVLQEVKSIIWCYEQDSSFHCKPSRQFYQYLLKTYIMLDYYQSLQEGCLGNGKFKEIVKLCGPELHQIPEKDSCENFPKTDCVVKELEASEKCSRSEIRDFKRMFSLMHTKCKIEEVRGKLWAEYLGFPNDIPY